MQPASTQITPKMAHASYNELTSDTRTEGSGKRSQKREERRGPVAAHLVHLLCAKSHLQTASQCRSVCFIRFLLLRLTSTSSRFFFALNNKKCKEKLNAWGAIAVADAVVGHYKASRGKFVAKCATNKEKDWKSFKTCTAANRFVVNVQW